MRSCAHAERRVARARIALGTLVEIALPAGEATEARFAAGFAAIAHVHRCMSAHDPASDLARIARDAHRWPVRVDPATYAVLTLALDLWRETGGAFDVTVAPALAREGLLPSDAFSPRAACGRTAALELLDDDRVRASESVAIDLGGIAKGYAVDRAVDALRTSGASSGIVNAGGDLRVFGMNVWFPVRVRHPASPNLVLSPFDVSDFAVATSADYFAAAPALVDPGHAPRATVCFQCHGGGADLRAGRRAHQDRRATARRRAVDSRAA